MTLTFCFGLSVKVITLLSEDIIYIVPVFLKNSLKFKI